MRKSTFLEPKKVLIFNRARNLVAIVRSVHSAADLTLCKLAAISFCCIGKYTMTGGYYFRHRNPKVLIETEDLDTLKLEEYDNLCGEKRKYYTIKQVMKLQRSTTKSRQSKYNKKNYPENDNIQDIPLES